MNNIAMSRLRTLTQSTWLSGAIMLALNVSAYAGPREEAFYIYNRLNGTPPDRTTLDRMSELIAADKRLEAAAIATDQPNFYNLILKSFVSPWTNEDENVNVPLNDFSATIIGIVRDDIPFDQVLYGDVLYTGADALVNRPTAPIAAYSLANNNHYQAMTTEQLDLKANLVRKVQSTTTGIEATAGVMTTRAFAEA
jgi:hypothetical protein